MEDALLRGCSSIQMCSQSSVKFRKEFWRTRCSVAAPLKKCVVSPASELGKSFGGWSGAKTHNVCLRRSMHAQSIALLCNWTAAVDPTSYKQLSPCWAIGKMRAGPTEDYSQTFSHYRVCLQATTALDSALEGLLQRP